MAVRMPVYRMNYAAEVEFNDAALFSAGNGVTTRALPAAQSFWTQWLGEVVGKESLACKGDRLQLTGTLNFGKRRSGWVSYGGQMAWTQDGTHREAPCVPPPPDPRTRLDSGATLSGLTRGQASTCESPGNRAVVIPIDKGGQAAFVGDKYHRQSTPSDVLSFGGWGDHYYDYIQFDLATARSLKPPLHAFLCLFVIDIPPIDPALVLGLVTSGWAPDHLTMDSRPKHEVLGSFGPTRRGWNAVDISSVAIHWLANAKSNHGLTLMAIQNRETKGSFASAGNEDTAKRPRLVFLP